MLPDYCKVYLSLQTESRKLALNVYCTFGRYFNTYKGCRLYQWSSFKGPILF
jgi:hypothetical protein